MFKWSECRGCDDFESCQYDGEYWSCPYAEAIQEDTEREEDF